MLGEEGEEECKPEPTGKCTLQDNSLALVEMCEVEDCAGFEVENPEEACAELFALYQEDMCKNEEIGTYMCCETCGGGPTCTSTDDNAFVAGIL